MSASNLPAGAAMTEFEQQIADALAEVRIVTPGLGRIRVGVNVATALAPNVAAAIIAARQVFQSVTFNNTNAWIDNENAPQQDADALSNETALRALRGETP